MPTNQNIIFFLLFIPVYQLFFFTIQLITLKKSKKRSRWYFGLLLLSLMLYLMINALFYLDSRSILVWSFYLLTPLFFVMIPLFYKYLVSITETKKIGLEGNILVLYMPAILILIFNIFTYGNLSIVEKLSLLYSPFTLPGQPTNLLLYTALIYNFGFIVLALVQITFYSFKVFKVLRYHKSLITKNASYLPSINFRWISIIFITLVIFIISNMAFNLITNFYGFNTIWVYNIFMIVSGALIGYFGLKQENLHEYIMRLSFINSKDSINSSNYTKERSFTIEEEEKFSILERLKNLMESKRLYLNSKLTIEDLAKNLNVNKRAISIVINDEMGANFYGFINDYRINESKKIITDPEMSHICMEGIAEKVGFTSKSSFYASFKKVTGKTPLQYKKNGDE